MSEIFEIQPGKSCRSSSYDTSGGNLDCRSVEPHSSHALLDVQGSGIIRHIWITIFSHDPLYRKKLTLRCTWDNAEIPSVDVPIGDFFGQGWGKEYNFSSPWLCAAPKAGRSLVCYFPMPFHKAAKIEVINNTDQKVERLYYYVDYESVDHLPENTGLFHAQYNQEITTPESDIAENEWSVYGPDDKHKTDQGNYLWMNTKGRGQFLGVNYYVTNPGPMWYGEGDDMFLIDGEEWPGLHGTGTEDYFNTAWSPNEKFSHDSFGIANVPGKGDWAAKLGWFGRTHLYRFHHHDPIRFQKSLKASIEHGHANNLILALESVAYWYQDQPSINMIPLPPIEERKPKQLPDVNDIHRWRKAYAKMRGEKFAWGDENRTDNDPSIWRD